MILNSPGEGSSPRDSSVAAEEMGPGHNHYVSTIYDGDGCGDSIMVKYSTVSRNCLVRRLYFLEITNILENCFNTFELKKRDTPVHSVQCARTESR